MTSALALTCWTSPADIPEYNSEQRQCDFCAKRGRRTGGQVLSPHVYARIELKKAGQG